MAICSYFTSAVHLLLGWTKTKSNYRNRNGTRRRDSWSRCLPKRNYFCFLAILSLFSIFPLIIMHLVHPQNFKEPLFPLSPKPVIQSTQDKLKTIVMQNLAGEGGGGKCKKGVL